jgi:16S rRNA (cytosine1402-N4)-methyltransferase
MVEEIVSALTPQPTEVIADCTLGYGGHTRAFLERTSPTGRVLAFDVDADEMQRTQERLAEFGERVSFHRSNFAGLAKVMAGAGLAGYDVIFADLGVSSMQLDNPDRGFSYKFDGPLDMRMDSRIPKTAADLLMTMSESEIAEALETLADEPHHRAIARRIVQMRQTHPVRRTSHLTRIIFDAKNITPKQWRERARQNQGELHPAARTFQALRILVNDELGCLRQLLRVAPSCLNPGGRLGIITFHSGEDGLVQQAFEQGLQTGMFSAVCEEAIRPSSRERYDNPRSASARFRWARRAVDASQPSTDD